MKIFRVPQAILDSQRKGTFIAIGAICLSVCLGFVAFSVDLGLISLTRTQMQNSCDAAALAAAMEITAAVQNAPPDAENVTAYAREQARQSTEKFKINWNIGLSDPANCVKVVARRENSDLDAPDGRLRLSFAKFLGHGSASLRTEATAYVEARDLVVVHDFSRSMNFDSYFNSEAGAKLTQAQIEQNLYRIWEDLGFPTYGSNMPFTPDWVTIHGPGSFAYTVRWERTRVVITSPESLEEVTLYYSNGNTRTVNANGAKSLTAQGSGSYANSTIVKARLSPGTTEGQYEWVWTSLFSGYWKWIPGEGKEAEIDFFDDSTILKGLGLNGVPYPWPDPPGNDYGQDQGNWSHFIRQCRGYRSGSNYYSPQDSELNNAGYGYKFGLMSLYHYQLKNFSSHAQFPDLWKARHYPFHSIKAGHALLCDFLKNLGFDDHLGMVTYDTYHRVEDRLNEHGVYIDLTNEPLSTRYDDIKTIMENKQAFHYYPSTNIGGGMRDAVALLDAYGRPGARPNILLMTDGNANVYDGSTNLPSGWESWFEGFSGEGSKYSVSHGGANSSEIAARKSLIYEVKRAVDRGYTVHTMAVGVDADWKTMQAIAFLGKGEFIRVEGATSVDEVEAEILQAFHRIAGMVPPARLLGPEKE